jgi:acyl-CoA thioesterase-1
MRLSATWSFLVLGWIGWLSISALGAEPAATKAATIVTKTRKVLCLGDSLTEGYGVAREAAWPELLQTDLKNLGMSDITIVNAGISGSTSASGLSRLKWFLKSPDQPEILILELGANDGLRGIDPKVTQKNLRDVIQLAKSRGIRVLLAGMQMPTNYGPEYTKKFAELYPEIAKDEGVDFIPFFLESVAGDRSLNQADGIHPNEAGYKIIAKTVSKYLLPLVSKGSKP